VPSLEKTVLDQTIEQAHQRDRLQFKYIGEIDLRQSFLLPQSEQYDPLRARGAAALGAVVDVIELQPISLVRLLDRLVEHGLLERRHDPRDRRANRLFLTASGRQLVDDLDSLRDSIASDVLQDIPAKAIETSLATLIDIKERIKGFAEPRGHIAAK
jgi:DNA-binding MarR family transcriptional regulator